MYNKKVLIDALKKLGSAKVPPNKKDIIYDPKGQLKYPGQNTRIPSGDITMQGVPYPVYAQPNVGQPQMMQPGQNYQFPGADYVDEFPQMRKGGRTKGLISMPKPSKKGLLSKSYSRSLDATNKFFTQNYLFAKPKSRKNKVFDPNAKYYAEGGSLLTKKVTCKKCGWKWDAEDGGKDITTCHKCGGQGLVHAQDGGESECPEGYIIYNGQCVEWQEPEVIETDENTGYNAATGQINRDTRPGSIENNDWWKEHEDFHHLQNLAGGMNTAGFLSQRPNNTVASDQAIGDYYNRRDTELEAQTDAMIKADPNLQFIPRNKLQEFTEGFPGANALMYQDPTTVEGEARVREKQFKKDGKSIFPKKQDGGDIDAMTGMMKARLAYANEFGNPAAERMINLPDNPYQFDNGDIGTHYMASMDNYAVPQIQDENGVLQLGDYGPESNEAIRFDSDKDANYFAENYKDVSPGFLNQKQYGGLHKFVEGGAEESWPPKGWPPIGRYKGLLDLVKKTPTISTFGNAIKLPSVNWITPSIPTLQREFNVEQVLKNKNFFPNENSFLNAVKNATVQEITPEIDATIGYRSGTTTKEDLIALSKTYGSWPEYRNEATINSIYDGLSLGKDMEMPMVLQFPNGNKRVFSGNTRMDAARQLGINPNVLMLNVPDMTKLANPWQREVFPGLQYKSTMLNNPKGLWTQVAKDGTINVENALKSIEKESAGDVKVELLKETIGENIPKKMDFNLFRKKTQESIVPLEISIVDHSSNYGVQRVGYPSASRNSFERALNFNNLEIAEIEKKIKDASSSTRQLNSWDDATDQTGMMAHVPFDRPVYEALGPNGLGQYFSTLEEAKQQEEITLRTLNEELKNSKDKSITTLTEMQDLPLENKTIIFSNKDLFGVGSDAHNNPPETLGHIHFLRDAEFPDILLATQIQSDPFQSKYYWKYNINRETDVIGSEILLKTKKIESINYLTAQEQQNFNNGNSNYSEEQLEEKKLSNLEEINILNNDINVLKERLEPIVKENTPNYKQKVLLDKNHKKRFFQEFLNYAANRGDVNYIAIPTVETSARIQNYAPLTNQANLGPQSKLLMDNTNSFEEFVKKSEEMYGEPFQNVPEQEQYLLKKGYELYKKDGTLNGLLNDKRNYKSKHGTVLGNYEEYIKIAKKLGLEIEDIIIKGHTYKTIVIPEDFLKGVGEIDAYRKGGETNKSIEIKLTSEEIKKYVDGGYVVEDLDNFQDGGTTDPPPPWNPDYPTNFYEFKTLTPEEKAEEAQFREDYRKAALTPYDRALEEEPQFADEAMKFVKGWHDSPMYNQMVLNSYNGQQKNADYLTKLRKENIAAIPPLEISNTSGTSDSGFFPAATSDSITGQVVVYPEGYSYGPSLYTHEYTHSSDKPRELYKWDHPSYVNKKRDTYRIPSWMVYEDPRFPKEHPVFHKRVMPKSDQMYISTHRGANWKDNENYKINKDSGFYTNKTDDELKQEMLKYEHPLDAFDDYKKAHISGTKDWIEMDKKQWKEFGHDYVSEPTEVRARLGEIRMNAKKEGLYDPYTEQITPEIFENYINKQREDDNWQPMKPIDELRIEFTDEEILYMLQNISENKNDSETDNEFDMQYSQYGGVADYQLGEEVDEDTMKRLKKLGYTFNKI